jgi:hypothetical protein
MSIKFESNRMKNPTRNQEENQVQVPRSHIDWHPETASIPTRTQAGDLFGIVNIKTESM